MTSLWDMLAPLARRLWQQSHDAVRTRQQSVKVVAPAPPVTPTTRPTAARVPAPTRTKRAPKAVVSAKESGSPVTAEERYEQVTRLMLERYEVKVRKWRTSMSGVAWELRYRDGSVKRMIEAPRPKGPMSAAVFLHEIGHHAIGFNRFKPRCLEEYHAWAWAIAAMEEHGLSVTESVRRRMHLSLAYAVAKARRRGLSRLPAELEPFQQSPPRKRA